MPRGCATSAGCAVKQDTLCLCRPQREACMRRSASRGGRSQIPTSGPHHTTACVDAKSPIAGGQDSAPFHTPGDPRCERQRL
jgi:hypothetical protein